MFREEMWRKNNYTSLNIDLPSDEDGSDSDGGGVSEEEEEEEEGGAHVRDIRYVSGDVTRPRNSDTPANIIVHCTGGHCFCLFIDPASEVCEGLY